MLSAREQAQPYTARVGTAQLLYARKFMEIYSITRRSPGTAEGDPVVLRETQTTRLVFKPLLVNSAQDRRQPVKGSFVFQRKSRNDAWEDHSELQLSNLKATEWVKIDIKAKELDTLLKHVAAMYRLHRRHDLPRGKAHYILVDLEGSPDAFQRNFDRILALSGRMGVDVVSNFIEWAIRDENAADLLGQLEQLDAGTLGRLNTLVGVTSLKSMLQKWEANQNNANEEFWQRTFQENAFVLSQVFSFPVLIISGKAYVGGKVVDNTGGHLADFLAANPITKNAVIVEIKTPRTKLLGKQYRAGVSSTSEELSGAVNQVLTYRHSLTTDFLSIRREHENNLEVFSPHCLVIAGHAREQLQDHHQHKSFELIRNSLKDVLVITYDELFEKTKQLIQALEGTVGDQL